MSPKYTSPQSPAPSTGSFMFEDYTATIVHGIASSMAKNSGRRHGSRTDRHALSARYAFHLLADRAAGARRRSGCRHMPPPPPCLPPAAPTPTVSVFNVHHAPLLPDVAMSYRFSRGASSSIRAAPPIRAALEAVSRYAWSTCKRGGGEAREESSVRKEGVKW